MIWRIFRSKKSSQAPVKKDARMSEQFPLVINFQGDYGMKLLMVDPQATLGQVAQLAKEGLVGVLLKPLPEGTVLLVRRHGESAVLDNSIKVADAGFIKMEALDIVHAA
jgi:hypothetical protein